MQCLIVDDSALFLTSARELLEREGVEVVGVASNGAQALQQTEDLQPDLVLVDIDLGPECGFDLAWQLDRKGRNKSPPPAIILISSHSEEDFEEFIVSSPAIGFLSKAVLSASAIRDLMHDGGEPTAAER
ncbi:LytR/AlgR family response regulator transcription factor [Dactylosporangium sp. McL0621]|uniref:LytR/AlgR family response regulator transcription factor n=1 Tax=Dactylosporangium sp. McL0621 TaxID=3415678 RepID=UPI003CE82DC4